jgi:ribosomal protein S18 acetylase RimI-like enzyme
MTINFVTMNDLEHKAEVLAMMHGLYSEDEAASPVDLSRFPLTIDFFLANPSHGRIVLFKEAVSVRGYALLVPYWSNEFGGALVVVDELFVTPKHRNRGIATSFFRFLGEEKPFDAVALSLELSPTNTGARRLYQSLGFASRRNSLLAYRFPEKGSN